jgi:HAD superfamily hydrolase (TIGR01509 family)
VTRALASSPEEGSGFDLVIFDCDGVLVDSEPLANRILSERLASAGLHMPMDEVMRTFVGKTREACIVRAGELLGRPLPADFAAEWDRVLYAALRKELRPVEGISAVLDALPMPYCAASNSSPERLKLALEATGLWERFEGRAFSAQLVANPKPAPDLFLHAAREMRVDRLRCAVVEDTPTGVRAGVAAGMTVFAYAAAPHADRDGLEREGGRVFGDMAELPLLLDNADGIRGRNP